MTLELLKYQPEEFHGRIMDVLRREVFELSVMLHLDFADQPLRLCNRTSGFDDLNGQHWAEGGGLVVGMPDLSGGQGQLAPLREFHLVALDEQIKQDNWRAGIVDMMRDKKNYLRRTYGLYAQLFDDEKPLGLPIAWDVGVMDRMGAQFLPQFTMVTMGCEGPLPRKAVPAYGMQTWADQKRRFQTDEGMQFTVENGNLIIWTNW